MTEPLLTAGEVAEILRVSEPTVRNLRRRGELRYARIGGKVLFRGVDVDAYVESKIEGGPREDFQLHPTWTPPGDYQLRPMWKKVGGV